MSVRKKLLKEIDDAGPKRPKGRRRVDAGSVYYVYALVDPRDGEPFYIGKGKGKRHASHWEEWKRGDRTNHQKSLRISQIVSAGYKPTIRIMEDGLTEEDALVREDQIIKDVRYGGAVLTNANASLMRAYLEARHLALQLRPKKQWIALHIKETGKPPPAWAMEIYNFVAPRIKKHMKHLRRQVKKEMRVP